MSRVWAAGSLLRVGHSENPTLIDIHRRSGHEHRPGHTPVPGWVAMGVLQRLLSEYMDDLDGARSHGIGYCIRSRPPLIMGPSLWNQPHDSSTHHPGLCRRRLRGLSSLGCEGCRPGDRSPTGCPGDVIGTTMFITPSVAALSGTPSQLSATAVVRLASMPPGTPVGPASWPPPVIYGIGRSAADFCPLKPTRF